MHLPLSMQLNAFLLAVTAVGAIAQPLDATASPEPSRLVKRNKSNIQCDNFSLADPWVTKGNHDYLDHGGPCSVDAGPNTCSRLACKDTSAIYLCNDNPFPISPSCNYIASYINDIVDQCHYGDWVGGALAGQRFDSDGYNVVVAYGNCNDSPSVRPDQYAGPGPNAAGCGAAC